MSQHRKSNITSLHNFKYNLFIFILRLPEPSVGFLIINLCKMFLLKKKLYFAYLIDNFGQRSSGDFDHGLCNQVIGLRRSRQLRWTDDRRHIVGDNCGWCGWRGAGTLWVIGGGGHSGRRTVCYGSRLWRWWWTWGVVALFGRNRTGSEFAFRSDEVLLNADNL